jgi:hypothetical protein
MRSRLIGLLCLLAVPAFAQLKLPALSPEAKVVQTAGLTTITIDYSSPGVKGRKIWGGVVPMDKVWRAGANQATTITFSQPVMIGDKEVAAGTYGFFAIPAAGSWTLILTKEPNVWGTQYKQENDVLRVTAKPQAIPLRERLSFQVTNFTNDAANIDLEWEKVRVTLPVKLKTTEQASANIKASIDTAWRPMTDAARYALEAKDYANGLTYIDRSIAVQETWLNLWVKAQLLAATGKKAEALPLAQKAQELGNQKPEGFFYADDVKKALTEWKGK